MILKRQDIKKLYSFIEKNMTKHFNIQTQYKLLKIKKILEEEIDIYNTQLASLEDFCEIKDGQYVINEKGCIKIKKDKINQCAELITNINNFQITLPDFYFSLEELEPLNLTLNELELLEPFIK